MPDAKQSKAKQRSHNGGDNRDGRHGCSDCMATFDLVTQGEKCRDGRQFQRGKEPQNPDDSASLIADPSSHVSFQRIEPTGDVS